MMINGTVVKHWSRTQATRALSVAESEYHAIVTGTDEGHSLLSDQVETEARTCGRTPTRKRQ